MKKNSLKGYTCILAIYWCKEKGHLETHLTSYFFSQTMPENIFYQFLHSIRLLTARTTVREILRD
jgi:hypothetical protein